MAFCFENVQRLYHCQYITFTGKHCGSIKIENGYVCYYKKRGKCSAKIYCNSMHALDGEDYFTCTKSTERWSPRLPGECYSIGIKE